jgi:hypothetical protein
MKRLFRQRNEDSGGKGIVRTAAADLRAFADTADTNVLNALKQLVDADREKSNAVTETPEPGTLPFLADEASRNNRDTVETAPIARTGHFAFALMDLVEQEMKEDVGAFDAVRNFRSLFNLPLDVVKFAHSTFLRTKALQLLYCIAKHEKIGLAAGRDCFVKSAVDSGITKRELQRIENTWVNVQKRAKLELDVFSSQMSSITVFMPVKVTSPVISLTIDRRNNRSCGSRVQRTTRINQLSRRSPAQTV